MRRASQSDMRCSNLMPLLAVTSVKNLPLDFAGFDGAEAMVVVTFFAGGSAAFLSSSV